MHDQITMLVFAFDMDVFKCLQDYIPISMHRIWVSDASTLTKMKNWNMG